MAEIKDKCVTVEELKLVYDVLAGIFELPNYSSANNGCFLGIQNGSLAWVKVSGSGDIDIIDPDAIGSLSSTDHKITINSDTLTAGTYTLYYEDENNNKLEGWSPINTVEVS